MMERQARVRLPLVLQQLVGSRLAVEETSLMSRFTLAL
jgi:hypothetical protein